MMLFRECLDAIEIHSNEQISILLELSKLELDEGLISDAIQHITNVREKCQDKVRLNIVFFLIN